jgi:murein DD-endopeptidase MepM/ murein hydrolase activator NlpD
MAWMLPYKVSADNHLFIEDAGLMLRNFHNQKTTEPKAATPPKDTSKAGAVLILGALFVAWSMLSPGPGQITTPMINAGIVDAKPIIEYEQLLTPVSDLDRILKELKSIRAIANRYTGTNQAVHTPLPAASKPSLLPVEGIISSPYGPRTCPVRKMNSFHHGIDIAAVKGTPVRAAASGVVVYSGWRWWYGKTVSIAHDAETISMYAHLNKVWVRQGQIVMIGEIIGAVGSTGRSTGPHLHYEIRVNNHSTNPVAFLPKLTAVAKKSPPTSGIEVE